MVPAGDSTTSKRRCVNAALNLGLITGFFVVLVSGNGSVGAVPLISFSTIVPRVSQPNRFWPPLGVQTTPLPLGVQALFRHFAEWYR